jgi:hypothetical protein
MKTPIHICYQKTTHPQWFDRIMDSFNVINLFSDREYTHQELADLLGSKEGVRAYDPLKNIPVGEWRKDNEVIDECMWYQSIPSAEIKGFFIKSEVEVTPVDIKNAITRYHTP